MQTQPQITRLLTALEQVILGKPLQLKIALVTLLARGHLLIEDLPGMGKTTLAHALAQVLGFDCRRVQFTADLLPADLLGLQIFDPHQQQFRFHPGPVFAQVLLADEINRASPKVQSALLEAMAEGKVSIGERATRCPPLLRHRHPEPGGSGGHLSPAGIPARSLRGAPLLGFPTPEAGVDCCAEPARTRPSSGS